MGGDDFKKEESKSPKSVKMSPMQRKREILDRTGLSPQWLDILPDNISSNRKSNDYHLKDYLDEIDGLLEENPFKSVEIPEETDIFK